MAPSVADVLHRMWNVLSDVSAQSYFDLSLFEHIAASETHFEVRGLLRRKSAIINIWTKSPNALEISKIHEISNFFKIDSRSQSDP